MQGKSLGWPVFRGLIAENALMFVGISVDTGRKLKVHKTFRRRPGRLLNVLCTFNLRPVSTWIAREMVRVLSL